MSEQNEPQKIELVMPKSHYCPKCLAESDGFTQVLHVNTSVGSELRCFPCYKDYVKSDLHLASIQQHIPILVKKLNEPKNQNPDPAPVAQD